jgi:hypothetical protein
VSCDSYDFNCYFLGIHTGQTMLFAHSKICSCEQSQWFERQVTI